MAQKTSIPKGTRDFSSDEIFKRNYIMATIRTHFELYGYQPIETPSFENAETLLGKYGEEGDRLIFKILNSGNYFYNKSKIEIPNSINDLQQNSAETITVEQRVELNKFTNKISEKALRYDLTVPFARYVVQNQNNIDFPFKRYQMQPVWRADNPQKGRFREFYQCDADVVGSKSLWQEVELIQLYDAVFSSLGLKGATIKINNRKILSGIAQVIGASDKLIDFTVALDKLDKIGEEGVKKEMTAKGISAEKLQKLQPLFSFTGSFDQKLDQLLAMLQDSEQGRAGVEELQFIYSKIKELGLKDTFFDLDVTLARGLNYYTGAIFEITAPSGVAIGSIGGGGRYDDLTSIFGLKNMSGVGISFGLDRIYLVLNELQLFPVDVAVGTKIIFLNNNQEQATTAMKAIAVLRKNNINAELYPDSAKFDKQYKYAQKRAIPIVVKDIINNLFVVKNMITGEQNNFTIDELLRLL